MLNVFDSDEIKQILRNAKVESGDAFTSPSDCDVAFVLFLNPGDRDETARYGLEAITERLICTFGGVPPLVHTELLLPPIPDSGNGRVHFGTYMNEPFTADWQDKREHIDNINYYLVANGSRWRALPVFVPHAVQTLRKEAEQCVGAPYSVSRYITSTRSFRRLAELLPDKSKSPGHCATLVARILRPHCDAVNRHPATYTPGTLYTALRQHAATHLTGQSREQMSDTPSGASTETVDALLRGPLSYETVQCVGDDRCIDAVRSLTLRVCNAAAAQDDVATQIAETKLASVLLRWVLLRKESCTAESRPD